MISAGAEGTIATWDFRKLSYLNQSRESMISQSGSSQTIREPMAQMKHCHSLRSGAECSGPVKLSQGVGSKYGQGDRSIMSVGNDGYIKEWDVFSGRQLNEYNTSHVNTISCFKTYKESENLLKGYRGRNSLGCYLGGTITAAWDGKISLRRMVLTKDDAK